MYIYLPIAEVSMHIAVIIGLGGGVGFLSGMFGVGGGFLMTPLLIFLGVPPAIAVSTEANQIVASSVSGVIAHWRRGNVDFKMGGILLAGGVVGSSLGVLLFSILRDIGQIDLVIKLSYVVFLGLIGGMMLLESIRAILRTRQAGARRGKLHQHNWLHGLPFKMRFRKSKLYISALLPFFLAAMVGVLSAIMGVGGGFILVPAMIYLLGMPTYVVIGTSLFQIIFVTANITVLQAVQTQTVDFVLAGLLLFGSVIGAQIGARFGTRLKGEQLRGLLALMVLGVSVKLGIELITAPVDVFAVEFIK
tara:strand:- start:601 stop:1515 length:915 start_codon:yes stop_codon:yes gene_type:complete